MVKIQLFNKKLKLFMAYAIKNIIVKLAVTMYSIRLYSIVNNIKAGFGSNMNLLKKLIYIIRKLFQWLTPTVMHKVSFIYIVEMALFYIERIISLIYESVVLFSIMVLMSVFYLLVVFIAGIGLTIKSIYGCLSIFFDHIVKLLNDLKNVLNKAVLVAFSLLLWIILIYLFLIMVLEIWLLLNKVLDGSQPVQYTELNEQTINETTTQIKQQLKLCANYFKRRTLMLMDRALSIFKSIDRALKKQIQHLNEQYSQQLITEKNLNKSLSSQIKKFEEELLDNKEPNRPI